MKKTYFKLATIIFIQLITSCNTIKNKNTATESLSGTWTGNYIWKCIQKNGNEKISFKIIEEKGTITGSVFYLDKEYKIKGYRLKDVELGEWRYQKGKACIDGNQIIIDFINKENQLMAINTFSGTIEGNTIIGITQNGINCSSFKGPSGNFSIIKNK